MRSLLVILATMLVLAGGFFLYFWMQPETRVARPEPNAQIAPMSQPSVDGSASQPTIRGGEGAWLKHFDDKTLALSYEFRGTKFTPQQNGTVDVDQPEARFYLDRGQLLTIRGKRGNVVMENGASPMESKPGGSQMPSRGELHDVILSLYPSVDATTPSLVCKMNNAAFDNDTFSISTAAYVDENGVKVPADRVKVEVRGDYEFDGEGLTIRWNERDRRLQMLEIAHGQRLLVKNPSAIGKTFGGGPATSPTETPAEPKPVAEATPAPAPSADDTAKGPTTRKKKPGAQAEAPIAKAPRIDPIYRASFNQNVRVLRSEAVVATADVMHVDFLTSDKHKAATQPVAPTTRRAKKPATTRAAAPVTLPTETPAPVRATSQPTTKRAPIFAIDSEESQQPMTILWNGKLHVAPIENLEDPPADSKDAVVRMIGSPVVLKNEGSELKGATVAFHTGRQDGYVRGSDAQPIVTATDANGAVINAPNIEYSNAGELATIRGPSSADLPLPAKEGETPAKVHAQWSRIARIYLASAGADSNSNKLVIQRAIFDGDVHINRPDQLDLQSNNLALRFDPPRPSTSPATTQEQSKQPELRQMLATGNVRTVLTDDAGKTQKINCDKLTLNTERDAAGKLYPHVVKASGNVLASDPEQELRAGQMNLVLKPSTRPTTEATTQDVASTNVVLEQMDATDNVNVKTSSGSIAHGDHLTVQGDEGSRQVDLMGEPFALVGDSQSTLQGKLIHFEEATQKVEVNSPGRLHAIQQAQQQGATTRPIDVTWQQRLEVQGKQNVVDIFGGVEIASNTADDQTLAKGNHVHLVLADKPPTTKPTTAEAKPSSAEAETTKPTKLANKNSPMNGFGDKTIRSVRVEENVVVNSKQTSDQDVTKLALYSPVLNYDMDAKLMTIDKPGRMLFQQDPVAGTTQPATTPAANPAKSMAGDLSNMRGATAFEWQKEFRYDEAKMQAKMTGDVRIVHQASDLTGAAYELDAGMVTADLEERPTTQPVATTQPQQKMRVKTVVADNDVTFRSDKLHFDAQHVDFNPNTHMLIATGTDRAPAELHEAEGFSSGTFTELRLNTITEEMEVRGFQAQIRRTRKVTPTTQP